MVQGKLPCGAAGASVPSVLIALAMIGGTVPALAADVTPPPEAPTPAPERGPGNFVSLGAAVAPDYIGSDDFQVIPFAGFRYETGFAVIQSRGLSLEADILKPNYGGAFSAGPLVKYRFGRDDVESNAVDALPDVDASVEVGGFLSYAFSGVLNPFDSITFRVEGAADVADGHGGYVITPSVTYATPLSRRFFTFASVSADFGDEEFNDSYFSVTAAGSAASGLAQFDADSGLFRTGVAVGGTYMLTESWGLTGIASYSRLNNDAEDSPIVSVEGSADQFFGGGGLMYRF